MHEYALASDIFRTVLATAKKHNVKRVTEIRIELGDFSLVVEDFLRQSFEIFSKDSVVEGAKLIFKRTPGILRCIDCGTVSQIWFDEEKEREERLKRENEKAGGSESDNSDNNQSSENESATSKYEKSVSELSGTWGFQQLGVNLFRCRSCGSRNTELTGGKELKVKNIQVED